MKYGAELPMEKTYFFWNYSCTDWGRSGPPLEISNLSNSPGKIPENSPFPFENKVIVPTHASTHPPPSPRGKIFWICACYWFHLYSLASIFMDFVTIKISMISKFVANDLINSLLIHYVIGNRTLLNIILLWSNLAIKSRKISTGT